MPKNISIPGMILEKNQTLTLEEFSFATKVDKNLIIEMVEYQLLHPEGNDPSHWRFDSISLHRGRIAASFYHELEVNLPGIALALDLLDKLEDLQKQVNIYKTIS